jgi:hypothetical protein
VGNGTVTSEAYKKSGDIQGIVRIFWNEYLVWRERKAVGKFGRGGEAVGIAMG